MLSEMENPAPSASGGALLSPAAVEQFVLLAKSAKGAAAVELIKHALEAPGVYVFGELLDMPNIAELGTGPNQNYLTLLKIFAFGTYRDYVQNKATLPEITPAQQKKLKHLTLVSLATKSKCISYATLLEELGISNVRELEDLIIEAVYADIVRGKLDQRNSQLELDYAIGRDVKPDDLNEVIDTLQKWSNSCSAVMSSIESEIVRANAEKNISIRHKGMIERELVNIKKTLKAQSQDDEPMSADSRDNCHSEKATSSRKQVKGKGLRGSAGKFWQKS